MNRQTDALRATVACGFIDICIGITLVNSCMHACELGWDRPNGYLALAGKPLNHCNHQYTHAWTMDGWMLTNQCPLFPPVYSPKPNVP